MNIKEITYSIIPEEYKKTKEGPFKYFEKYASQVFNGLWYNIEDGPRKQILQSVRSEFNKILKKAFILRGAYLCGLECDKSPFIKEEEFKKIEIIKNFCDPYYEFTRGHTERFALTSSDIRHITYAIIFTTAIVNDTENSLQTFYHIYTLLFKMLGIDSYDQTFVIKLYPHVNSLEDTTHLWNDFLQTSCMPKSNQFIILCLTIYLAIKCSTTKISANLKRRLSKKWYEYLLNLTLNQSTYKTHSKTTPLIEKLNEMVLNKTDKTKFVSLLQTNFSRHVDDPRGAFPMPEHYVHRKEFMNDLLTTAFNDSKTLFLTGDRGIGKSLFAKSYALQCAQGDEARAEYQYEHIIWTTYDVAGIYATISSLPCTENIVGDLFTTKIAMMKELSQAGKRLCLLVVDNFDFENTESLLNELKSNAFSDLIKTGWHILFTTKNNMEKITLSSIREKTLPPLSLSELKTLFHNTLNNSNLKLEDDKLTILIEMYLKHNTYLVSLAAGLCDTLLEINCETLDETLDYIIQAFKKLNVSSVGGAFSGEKDGNKQTFMEHYKTMFALSNIQDDKDKMKLLYNLACVPISGVNRISFFKDAFEEEEREKMRNVCNELISSRWVIYEKENNILSLHPMVREIIKESAMPVDFVTRYICVLNKKSRCAEFSSIPHIVELLKAAYQILDTRDWKKEQKEGFLNYCQLVSLISTHFDTLHGFRKEAYIFGCRAIELLDQYRSRYESLCNAEKIILAESYNDCGYAILHYRDQKPDVIETAHKNFKEAECLIGKSDISEINEETDFPLALVQTSVQGNLAAWHYTLNEYPEGVTIHKHELAYRQKLSILFASNETVQQKIRTILGNSHKGIATGLFYIGRENNDFETLYQSYYHHKEASTYYDSEKINHSLLIAQVRMLGAVVELMKNHFEKLADKVDVNELTKISLKQCLSAAQFYNQLKFSVPDEYEEWIKRTLALGNFIQLHQDKINQFDVTGIIEQIYTLYYNNDKTRDILKTYNIKDIIIKLKEEKKLSAKNELNSFNSI